MEYRERLSVPLRWWVQATMFLASVWLAFVVALPGPVAFTAAGTMALVVFGLFLGYGAARIEVVDGELRAGRARVPLAVLGGVETLDADGTRRVMGVDADARAYLLTRPYLRGSVRVRLDDPADPTPYWLLSTRRPDQLAAVLAQE